MGRQEKETTFSYKGPGGVLKHVPINFGRPLEEVESVTEDGINKLLEALHNTIPLNPQKNSHL